MSNQPNMIYVSLVTVKKRPAANLWHTLDEY